MILSDPFNVSDFEEFIAKFLPDFKSDEREVSIKIKGFSQIRHMGISEELKTSVLIIRSSVSMSSRITLTSSSFRVMRSLGIYRALAVYLNEDETIWRFSLLTAQPIWSDGKVIEKLSNPKRYSYVLGSGVGIATANRYLVKMGKISDFADLQHRFSVEVVNNDFYREIATLFDLLVGTESIKGVLKIKSKSANRQEFAVRLLGRIIFCWFLKEKKSIEGSALITEELLSRKSAETKNYYDLILAPLFFEVLNKPLTYREAYFQSALFRNVPYLNGGLFNPNPDDFYEFDKTTNSAKSGNVVITDSWLQKLFDLLELYNFTVDENTIYDVDLSIDPEMLGRIFENLLARINPETGESVRGSTGSFYTPREIVEFMVSRSLREYLQRITSIEKEKLEALISTDSMDDLLHPLTDHERGLVVSALSQVRILDPACGSGAFPIGVLQKIVFILQRVDTDSKLWLDRQLSGASYELRRHLEHEFENSNFDYLRKLGIINQSIYGIDIQSIATEISRLRCFLTLIVEQSVEDASENRGIEPLPNLDFKFVTANSLMNVGDVIYEKEQLGLFEDRSGIDDLRDIRNRYFSSHNLDREKLKSNFVQVQNKMLQNMISNHTHGHAEVTKKLSSWDPFSHEATIWFDAEWMFGVSDGFDIVIGNPPYVSALKSVKDNLDNRETYRNNYKELSGAFDLYVVFLLRGLQLLKKDGFYSWIIPNKLTVASYAKNTLYLLKSKGLMSLVSVSMAKVFDASVYPVVIFGKNHGSPLDYSEYTASSVNDLAGSLEQDSDDLLNNNRYLLINATRIKMSSGATGFQAQMIKEYLYDNPGKNRIPFTVSGCIDPYVVLDKPVRYMNEKYERAYVEKRGTAIAESKWNLWEGEKIVIAGMTKRIEAVLSTSPLGIGVGTYAIHAFGGYDKHALLGLLNSKFMSFYLTKQFKAKHLAGGYLAINKETLEQLPLPKVEPHSQRFVPITSLVKQIVKEIPGSEEFSLLQNEIDIRVYELYNFTSEEIAKIEAQTF